LTPDAIAPPFLLAAGLLVVAGAAKLLRPRATAQAMADVGLPGADASARALGTVEVAAGLAAILIPMRGGAVVLAVVYLLFAGFLAYVLRVHPDTGSCGCAGANAVPPSVLHLGLNLLAAGAGVTCAVVGGQSPARWVLGLGVGALPVVVGLALAGYLAVVAVVEVPAAWRAWVPPQHVDDEHHHHGDDHVRADEALATAGIGPGHPSLWPGVGRETAS
jgi:hypothetical protein